MTRLGSKYGRCAYLVSGHLDQLFFIAISLNKTPFLASAPCRRWLGSGGTITPSCIAFSRPLTFSTIPSPSTSTLATAGRSLVADILVLRRLMIAMNFLPLQLMCTDILGMRQFQS